jgi:phosphatidate cytidylyltransferase
MSGTTPTISLNYMALSNLQTRIITGFVMGIILIGGTLLSEYILCAIGLFVMFIGLYEFNKIQQKLSIKPNIAFVAITNLLVFGACIYFQLTEIFLGISKNDVFWFSVIMLSCVFMLFISELFRASEKPIENIATSLLSIFYIGIPCGLLVTISIGNEGDYLPWNVLYLFFFIWASDTGAYFTGRALGRNKLFARISPNKTIEGFVGGLIASALVGIAAHHFLGGISLISWMCIGAFVSITSTLGDLFESMLKRQSDIKDSGNILPGHGGILDRFDSTLISAPIYWILLHVFI